MLQDRVQALLSQTIQASTRDEGTSNNHNTPHAISLLAECEMYTDKLILCPIFKFEKDTNFIGLFYELKGLSNLIQNGKCMFIFPSLLTYKSNSVQHQLLGIHYKVHCMPSNRSKIHNTQNKLIQAKTKLKQEINGKKLIKCK